MRGNKIPHVNLFSFVHLWDRIPHNHPLRPVRTMVDQMRTDLNGASATI